MVDVYKTIAQTSEGVYKEKGSKFIAIASPIYSEEGFKEFLSQVKKDYHDARHHCYAFKIGLTENEYRYNDDGEPNNSAGAPIYGQINSFNVTNIAIIVVRYFGGTKLGVGGLITAYKEAAKEALQNAKIIERTVDNFYRILFGYEIMSDVMNFIKQHQLEVTLQELEEKGTIEFRIRQSEAESTIENLQKIEGLKIIFLKTT
jgi:uncharacterized YigZ family protein